MIRAERQRLIRVRGIVIRVRGIVVRVRGIVGIIDSLSSRRFAVNTGARFPRLLEGQVLPRSLLAAKLAMLLLLLLIFLLIFLRIFLMRLILAILVSEFGPILIVKVFVFPNPKRTRQRLAS